MSGFTKAHRAGFKYTFAHWCSYQMTALNLGVWKWKYLFHDIEKPFLLIWFKLLKKTEPYKHVQKWHRYNRRHHIEHKNIDAEATIIDWECSRFTKTAHPETAYEYFHNNKHLFEADKRIKLEQALNKFKLNK